MHHQTQLVFVFLVEIRFHHVDKADLKLLTTSDSPPSASQSVGITRHEPWARLAAITSLYLSLTLLISLRQKILALGLDRPQSLARIE